MSAKERLERLRNAEASYKKREASAIALMKELLDLTITLQRAAPRTQCGPEGAMCACTGHCQFMHAEVSNVHSRVIDFIYPD